MAELIKGWGFPINSKKAHFFLKGESISVCGRMMYTGERENDKHDFPDNCAECKRRRERLIKKGKLNVT